MEVLKMIVALAIGAALVGGFLFWVVVGARVVLWEAPKAMWQAWRHRHDPAPGPEIPEHPYYSSKDSDPTKGWAGF